MLCSKKLWRLYPFLSPRASLRARPGPDQVFVHNRTVTNHQFSIPWYRPRLGSHLPKCSALTPSNLNQAKLSTIWNCSKRHRLFRKHLRLFYISCRMEAVGLTASITQLVAATTKAIRYINDVKNAPRERATLLLEATTLLALLTSLGYKVEVSRTTDPWFENVRSLGLPNGPLAQFKEAMVELARKLKPESGMKKVGKALVWTLDKKDIDGILAKIERLKNLVSLAVQNDNL